MTRRRRSIKEAALVKMHLADIIQDVFDNDGQLITHEQLAKRHVLRNGSLTAMEDVQHYGGPAVAYLRAEPHNYAIVPVTAEIREWNGSPDDEVAIANTVAGLGAGGPRIGWYHPAEKDDWLWVYYVGHLGRAGIRAVFHAGRLVDANRKLISAKGRRLIAGQAAFGLPVPPDQTETKLLEERLK